jgi:hypothetical protein
LVGEAKWVEAVLFERGWINPDVPHGCYTVKGMQEDLDEHGELNEEGKKYCLTYLLNQCNDFIKKDRSQRCGQRIWPGT